MGMKSSFIRVKSETNQRYGRLLQEEVKGRRDGREKVGELTGDTKRVKRLEGRGRREGRKG